MKNLDTSYLINKLEEGRNLNVLYVSHNAYWTQLQKLDRHYENFNVQIHGEDVFGSVLESEVSMNAYDVIVYYSSNLYDAMRLNDMKNLTSRISENNGKRVSIGYSYIIPEEEREHKNIKEEIKFISFKSGVEDELTYGMSFFTPLDLTEITVLTHDNFENQKCKKK